MPRLIVISGPQGSGKSTLSSALEREFMARGLGAAVTIKFADPLYGLQKVVHDYVRMYCDLPGLAPGETKDRTLLQFLGSEWGQARFGSDVWVRVWKSTIARLEVGLVLNDDLRFPHELVAAKELGAITIRLRCDDVVRMERLGLNYGGSSHISERALEGTPDSEFDFVFDSGAQDVTSIVQQLVARGVMSNGDQEEQEAS